MEIFISIVLLVFAFLQIILFFKIWGMTNDIRALKNDHFASAGFEDVPKLRAYLSDCVVLDDKANVKRALLQDFIDNINGKCNRYKNAYLPENSKSMDVDITPEVEMLKKQLSKIDIEVPKEILNMKTYRDYYQFFTIDELTIKK